MSLIPEKAKLHIDFCGYDAAKYAVLRWHYSKCMPVGKLIKFGVWENDKFIGAVIFGRGANKGLLSPYGLLQIEGCELVRVALSKHETSVSRILAIVIKQLKINYSGIKAIVSFADSIQGHIGGIYQAGGWLYTGMSNSADEYIYNGKRWHGRAFRKSHGSHLNYGDKVQIINGAKKYRYIMLLDKKIEIKSMSYPKRSKQAMADTLSTAAV